MSYPDEVRVYGLANPAALHDERDVMRRAVTAHTDGLLMLSALDCAGLHGPVAIPKVDEAVEAIWRVVREQKVSLGGEVA